MAVEIKLKKPKKSVGGVRRSSGAGRSASGYYSTRGPSQSDILLNALIEEQQLAEKAQRAPAAKKKQGGGGAQALIGLFGAPLAAHAGYTLATKGPMGLAQAYGLADAGGKSGNAVTSAVNISDKIPAASSVSSMPSSSPIIEADLLAQSGNAGGSLSALGAGGASSVPGVPTGVSASKIPLSGTQGIQGFGAAGGGMSTLGLAATGLGTAAGAYGVYDAYKSGDELRGGLSGAMSGAGIGSMLAAYGSAGSWAGPIGAGIGALVGAGLALAGGDMPHPDTVKRRQNLERYRQLGLITGNTINGLNGPIASVGSARDPNYYNIKDNRIDTAAGQLVGALNPFVQMTMQADPSMPPEERQTLQKQQSDVVGMLTNSILKSGGNPTEKVRQLYDKLGISRDDVYTTMLDLSQKGALDSGTRDAYLAGIDRVFGVINPNAPKDSVFQALPPAPPKESQPQSISTPSLTSPSVAPSHAAFGGVNSLSGGGMGLSAQTPQAQKVDAWQQQQTSLQPKYPGAYRDNVLRSLAGSAPPPPPGNVPPEIVGPNNPLQGVAAATTPAQPKAPITMFNVPQGVSGPTAAYLRSKPGYLNTDFLMRR